MAGLVAASTISPKVVGVVLGVLAAVALGCGFYYGGYTTGIKHAAKAQTIVQTKYVHDIQTQIVQRTVRDTSREQALQKALDASTNRQQAVKTILIQSPPTTSPWFLSNRDVSLLNASARPDTSLPGASSLLDATSSANSTVDEPTFVLSEIQLRGQYVDLAARHDALVDWVNTELVAPNAKAAKQ